MSEDKDIKGPDRVWVRVTRDNAAGEVVDQVNAAGDWQKHATQFRNHWISGTWREYVRADLLPASAPLHGSRNMPDDRNVYTLAAEGTVSRVRMGGRTVADVAEAIVIVDREGRAVETVYDEDEALTRVRWLDRFEHRDGPHGVLYAVRKELALPLPEPGDDSDLIDEDPPEDELPTGWRWEWREADIPFGEDGDPAWFAVRTQPFRQAISAAAAWKIEARDLADGLIDEDPPQMDDLVPVVLRDMRFPMRGRPPVVSVLADRNTAVSIKGAHISGSPVTDIDWPLVIACLEDAIRRARKAAKGPDGSPMASLTADRIREQITRLDGAVNSEVPF